MRKVFYSFVAVALLSMGGCVSYSHDHTPPPPLPTPKKVVTIFKNKGFDNIPGTSVSDRAYQNIRVPEEIEHSYNGAYIDPNRSDVMYGAGDIYRVAESAHWNLVPNPNVKPYEMNQAYKHIHNLANATPLYAELELKTRTTEKLNNTLRQQINVMKSLGEKIKIQAKEIGQYKKQIAHVQDVNSKLHEENQQLALKKDRSRKSTTVEVADTKKHSDNTPAPKINLDI